MHHKALEGAISRTALEEYLLTSGTLRGSKLQSTYLWWKYEDTAYLSPSPTAAMSFSAVITVTLVVGALDAGPQPSSGGRGTMVAVDATTWEPKLPDARPNTASPTRS